MTEYVTRPCMACVVGLFEECHFPRVLDDDFIIPCAVWLNRIDTPEKVERNPVGRPLSSPDEITDAKSTGRKRAKALHPILDGMRCDWQGLKFAGGGVIPILGCLDHTLRAAKGKAEGLVYQGDLHHGPDKNVLHNTPGVNLHAICSSCHHRWHSLNDEFYETPRPNAGTVWLPNSEYYLHDPVTAFSEDEWKITEEWWETPVADRGPYPFAPSEFARKVLPTSSTLDTLPHNPFTQEGFNIL